MLLRRYHDREKAGGVAKKATPSLFNETPIEEESKEAEFTAEEVEKMPFMKLRSVAKKYGVEIEGMDAKDIRSELIERLN